MSGYANLGGNSSVSTWQVVNDFDDPGILVKFSDGSHYVYTESSVGKANLQTMIQLAKFGQGLNSFIMRNVRDQYARRY